MPSFPCEPGPAGHAAPAQGDAARCQALSGKTIAPNMKVLSAEYRADGATVDTTKVDAPCAGSWARPRRPKDSRIGFEVWLPPASVWNGKFQGEGSGGCGGAISPGPMLTALKAGYATMSTDNGHVTDPNASNGGNEQSWALGHPGEDGGFRLSRAARLHRRGEDDRAAFLWSKASESYFVGCSQGGHHALMEATPLSRRL